MNTQTATITRAEYMADPCHMVATPNHKELASAAHRAYYAQFVSPATIAAVVQQIGAANILASTDVHMNDIPLERWDRLSFTIAKSFQSAGDYATKAGLVCVGKEAARQWLESQADRERAE